MAYCCHIRDGAAQFLTLKPLPISKAFVRSWGWWIVFHPTISFSTEKISQVYPYYLYSKCSEELHSSVPPAQIFTNMADLCPLGWISHHTSLVSRVCHSENVFYVDTSPNIAILISSGQRAIIIHPLYLHNIHVLLTPGTTHSVNICLVYWVFNWVNFDLKNGLLHLSFNSELYY